MDRKNTKTLKGNTRVVNTDALQCQNAESDEAITFLRTSRLFCNEQLNIDFIISNNSRVDIPYSYESRFGANVGDSALGEGVLVDLSNAMDDGNEEGS